MPEGPELLRHAEHHVVSKLEAAASAREQDHANGSDGRNGPGQERAHSDAGSSSVIAAAVRSAERRSMLLNGVKTIPISIPAESRLVCVTDPESPTAEAIRLLGVGSRTSGGSAL